MEGSHRQGLIINQLLTPGNFVVTVDFEWLKRISMPEMWRFWMKSAGF